jgi:hypothetical protein
MQCTKCASTCMRRMTHIGFLSSGFFIRGTMAYGVHLHGSPQLDLVAYSDADWAGCPDTRRSTSGYCVFLNGSLISWSSKRQSTVSRSSAEAEYRGVANATAECCWLQNLLRELYVDIQKATVVYCDNVSAIYLSQNPVHHLTSTSYERRWLLGSYGCFTFQLIFSMPTS